MSDADVLDIISGAFSIAAKIAGPILAVALIVGVVVSLLQTITQIQEMTLTFVPKLVGAGVVVLIAGNWDIRAGILPLVNDLVGIGREGVLSFAVVAARDVIMNPDGDISSGNFGSVDGNLHHAVFFFIQYVFVCHGILLSRLHLPVPLCFLFGRKIFEHHSN